MTVFNAEEVKKCLEDVVGEDKEYALWLLEWAINKRSFDLEEYRKQIRAEVIDNLQKLDYCTECEKQGENVDCYYCRVNETQQWYAEQLRSRNKCMP